MANKAVKPLRIHAVDKAHWPRVYDIERRCFGDHSYPDFFFRQAVDAWPDGLIAAYIDGKPVGYALCVPAKEKGTGWIMSLAVLESHRGAGVGKALMQHCLTLGYAALRLTVAPSNPAAALYQRLGFSKLGLEDDYFGEGEARLLLEWRACGPTDGLRENSKRSQHTCLS